MQFWIRFSGAAILALAVSSLSGAPKWQERYAEVNGVRLHFVEQGEGPLILFLHGFPEFWYSWKDLLADFGRDHHAVALDMRGHGASAHADPPAYRIEDYADDVAACLDGLGFAKEVTRHDLRAPE